MAEFHSQQGALWCFHRPDPIALSLPARRQPKSQQSRVSVSPEVCQPLQVAKLHWRPSKAPFTEKCPHSARSLQFPGNGNCLSSRQPGVVTTIRVNNKITRRYKRKSWRERCPKGALENSVTFLGIWKAMCRCRAVYMPRKELVRPAVSPLAERRLCASRTGKLR